MLHFEWTMKALLAGKHVLCEKPFSDTAEEAEKMFDLAEKKGLVLLEAFHYRYVLLYSLTSPTIQLSSIVYSLSTASIRPSSA